MGKSANPKHFPVFRIQSDNSQIHPLLKISQEEYEALSPMLRACLNLAAEAHEHDAPRQKEHVSIPYIHHLIGAMKLLQEMGIHDEVTLASALLHDTLEQGKFRHKSGRLFVSDGSNNQEELSGQAAHEVWVGMAKKMLADRIAGEIAKETGSASTLARYNALLISNVVAEVTNQPELDKHEHRRFVQARMAQHYSPRAQKVKMADMASSLLDDLLYDRFGNLQDNLIYFNRVMTIADACKESSPRMFELIYRLAAANTDVAEGKRRRPRVEMFDLQGFTDQGVPAVHLQHYNETKQEERRYKPLNWVDESMLDDVRQGIVSVALATRLHPNSRTDKGIEPMVAAFRIMDDHGGVAYSDDPNSKINQIKSAFCNELGVSERTIISVDAAGQHAAPDAPDKAVMATKITLKPAIPLGRFMALAVSKEAISPALAQAVEQVKSQLLPQTNITDRARATRVVEPQDVETGRGSAKPQPL